MRLELVKRPQHSNLFMVLSPFIAFALTLLAGAIMFLALLIYIFSGGNHLRRAPAGR